MATRAQALKAKAQLKQRLEPASWLRGIGIGRAGDGTYCVVVNVDLMTSEIRAAVPEQVSDTEVRVKEVGDIYAAG
jgi:hypothetical protein